MLASPAKPVTMISNVLTQVIEVIEVMKIKCNRLAPRGPTPGAEPGVEMFASHAHRLDGQLK